MSDFKYHIAFIVLLPGLIFTKSAFADDISDSPPLFLNEIMASNALTITDEDGDYSDWIEIYYDGDEPISLRWFGLSDDPEDRFQWLFPDTTIHPGEFLLIWASGKDRSVAGEPLHTNFRINKSGEPVFLSHPITGLLDQIEARYIPTDISVGRVPDGYGEWFYFNDPTPMEPNISEPYTGITGEVAFSHEAGFYDDDFPLSIIPPGENATIYYTTDGSEPTRESPVYTEPLPVYDRSDEPNVFSTIRTSHRTFDWRQWYEPSEPVAKSTIIRTKTVSDSRLPVYDKRTYFVMDEGANRYTIPVVSIATDSTNLFDYHTGIYIPGVYYSGGGTGNEFQRGREWEREATLEFFDESGERVLHQNIGIRIHGGFSRQLAQKSLRLYARNEYGDNRFRYPFFPDENDSVFNRLLLRNSGNTWGEDMFMDAAAQSLIRHFNVDTQAYLPTVLFLNGEFWGIHNIRERYDKHYLEREYGIDPENIDLLTRRNEVKEGDTLHYSNMLDFIYESDLSDDEAMAEVATMIDLDNLLDYYSAQVYYGNNDWPHNNIDFWRSRVPFDPDAPKGQDGRWRWLLFDVDRSLGHETGPEFNMITWITQPEINGQKWPNKTFLNLLENDQFKRDFINRVADHLNTTFQPERVKQIIDSLQTPVATVIGEHIDRWSLPESVTQWEGFVQNMFRFADERPDYIREHIKRHFNLPVEHEIILETPSPDLGHIVVNEIPITEGTPGISDITSQWTGIYFHGIPITLNAHPQEGKEFAGWVINDQISLAADTILTIFPEPNLQIEALFSETSGINPEETPKHITLHQNYPNPFNPTTVISFDLTERSEVNLDVYDILGQRVAIVTRSVKDAGSHAVTWDATGFASGIYITHLTVAGLNNDFQKQLTGKMTLVK